MGAHTPGPWGLCYHLESAINDAACPCGYRGGIWGPDGEHTICEIGSTVVPGEEGLEAPRYPRPVELANARLIAAAPDLLALALRFKEFASSGGHFAYPLGSLQELEAAISKATREAS